MDTITKENFPPPLRSTLAAVDLTNNSLPALEAANVLAPQSGGVVHAVHCVQRFGTKADQPVAELGAGKAAKDREEVTELRHQIERHIRRVIPSSRSVDIHLRQGVPHRAITTVAKETGVDLIVLGSHQPRHMLDSLMGTTVDRVLRTASHPCLVVNRTLPALPRRIVVASDLSRYSDRALALAASWAREWNTQPDRSPSDRVEIEVVYIAAYASPSYRVADSTKLQPRVERIETLTGGAIPIRSRILSAPLAPDGIRRIAESGDIDMLFMGTHGSGFVMRALLGSVAAEVVRSVRLPIVVVPPSKEQT